MGPKNILTHETSSRYYFLLLYKERGCNLYGPASIVKTVVTIIVFRTKRQGMRAKFGAAIYCETCAENTENNTNQIGVTGGVKRGQFPPPPNIFST
jgi:hypothetical protein